MIPVAFEEANCTLTGSGEVGDLPVCRVDEMIISRWRPTWRERLSMLVYGRVWLYVLHPRTQPPVVIEARRDI